MEIRPIDANALLGLAHNHVGGTVDCNDIARFPTLEYVPVKHGEWIEDKLEYPEEVIFRYKCSECGRTELVKEPYCHCGAKMDGEAGV